MKILNWFISSFPLCASRRWTDGCQNWTVNNVLAADNSLFPID